MKTKGPSPLRTKEYYWGSAQNQFGGRSMTGHIKKKQAFCDVDADIKGSSCLPYHTATFLLFKMQLILKMEDDKNEGGRGEG